MEYIILHHTSPSTTRGRILLIYVIGVRFTQKSMVNWDNKDLAAILLNEDNREEKPFCKSAHTTTFVNSRGRIEIQDFEPKTYFFSLGFECFHGSILDCFQYNVTIYDESNTTRCVDLNMTSKYSEMSQQNLTDHCETSYQYAAIPNQFWDTDLDGALSRINEFLRVYHSDDPSEHFLKNLKTILV